MRQEASSHLKSRGTLRCPRDRIAAAGIADATLDGMARGPT
jgi:hypothetical protein